MTLRDVLDESVRKAGPYLRSSFRMPEHSLSAAQLVGYLEPKDLTVSLATVTKNGEPRVTPIGAVFHDGRFASPILTTAARVKHVRRNPAVGLTYYEGNDLAVIVHGNARVLLADDDGFTGLADRQHAVSGGNVLHWGPREHAAFLVIEPDVMYTFAREPKDYPS